MMVATVALTAVAAAGCSGSAAQTTAPGSASAAASASGAAATGAASASPSATTSANASASLAPTAYDAKTGQIWGPNIADACTLIPLETVRSDSGVADAARNPTNFVDACDWVYPNKQSVTLTVERYLDAEHATAALTAHSQPQTGMQHVWAKVSGVGDSALIDTAAGDAMSVSGSWVVIISAGTSDASTTRGAAAAALLPVAVGNLPR